MEAGLGIGFVGPRLVLVELRNGYSGQNADDGDNYEQLDQGKTLLVSCRITLGLFNIHVPSLLTHHVNPSRPA